MLMTQAAEEQNSQLLESMWYAGMNMGNDMSYSNYYPWQLENSFDDSSGIDDSSWTWTAEADTTGCDYHQAHTLAEDLLRAVDDEDAIACADDLQASSFMESPFLTNEAFQSQEWFAQEMMQHSYTHWHSS
jgi:hypothetical protein